MLSDVGLWMKTHRFCPTTCHTTPVVWIFLQMIGVVALPTTEVRLLWRSCRSLAVQVGQSRSGPMVLAIAVVRTKEWYR